MGLGGLLRTRQQTVLLEHGANSMGGHAAYWLASKTANHGARVDVRLNCKAANGGGIEVLSRVGHGLIMGSCRRETLLVSGGPNFRKCAPLFPL